MSCPNCGTNLTSESFHNLDIFHCENCGGTFFEEYAINRIDVKLARKLSADKISDYISDKPKICPRDQAPLSLIVQEESIPQDVHLFQCQKCKGIFVYPDDLVRFKIAQAAKINYFKIWNIPPALKSLLVLSFIIAISLAVFGNSLFFNKSNISPTKAEDIVKNIQISASAKSLFISFKTPTPYTSRIIFFDKTTNSRFEQNVSSKPTTIHYLVIGGINTSHNIFYQIIVTDKAGKEVKTKELKFNP